MTLQLPSIFTMKTQHILTFKSVNKVDIVLQYLSCRLLQRHQSISMKGSNIRSQLPYLDISEFLFKEHSPCFKPKVPQHLQILSPRSLTPELSPVIDGMTTYMKTPLMRSGKEIGSTVFDMPDLQDFNDFSLEGSGSKNQPKSKKIKKMTSRPRLNSTWHFVDCQLEKIVQENDKNDQAIQNSSIEDDFSEEQRDQMIDNEDSERQDEGKEFELEKQSTTNFDLLLSQQPLFLQWHQTNPKKELINKIKSVCSNEQLKSDEQKKQCLKTTIGNYIFDHERFYFEESLNHLNGSISSVLATLMKGIDQTFRKTIGGLSFQKRRLKLVKYMEKKKRRVWRKKVNYDCRKKVADGRLRIKGKFVTYEQALEQLGMSSLEGYNADEIRNMIERKNDS